ncbi:MAG: glycosyltransferase [Thermoguttaceae bacterium]
MERDPGKSLTAAVAIPTYGRERVLVDTCRQVLALDPPADEVLVVDQTPQHEPETDAYLKEQSAANKLRWIRQSWPNLPAARNRALAETRCDVLIFVDDDVRLPTDFVEKHRRNYVDSAVCGVAGRVVPGAEVRQRTAWPPIMDHRFFPLGSTERQENVVTFRGCNHSLRTSFLRKIGGFDENYLGWAFREDSDVAIRCWKSGGVIVFDPEASLEHLAIPGGGCRLKRACQPLSEWKVSFPATYFAARHLFPTPWFWFDLLLGNVRRYVLRRDNVFHPYRLPWALASYCYSVALALSVILYPRSLESPDQAG